MFVQRDYGLVVDGYVVQSAVRMEEDEGPPLPAPGSGDWRLLPERPDWSAPAGARLKWIDFGVAPTWEIANIVDLQAAAIAKTYTDVDAVYDAAVGNREPEYAEAAAIARAFLAAEVKPSPVSEYITGHALNNPTGQVQSEAWAAQQIIERADAFNWAKLQMRNVRFARQADMRAATTPEELAAVVSGWDDFITWLRATLGL